MLEDDDETTIGVHTNFVEEKGCVLKLDDVLGGPKSHRELFPKLVKDEYEGHATSVAFYKFFHMVNKHQDADSDLKAVLSKGDKGKLYVYVGASSHFTSFLERDQAESFRKEVTQLQEQLDKEKKEKEDAEEEKRKENEAFNNEKKNQEEEERKRKEKEDFKEEDAPFCEELKDELESVKGDIEKEKVKAQELKKELASRKAFLEKAIKKMQVFVKPTNTTGQVKTEAAARSRRTGTRWHKPVGRFIKNFLKK
eukprot:CAMPEP_0179235694 /NCGR_PEP_ID=MMETSP0797-20121207/13543_1 /TAXON_ID=47934 /ORGANISM="Dinophysis acuminata, Strain DAEP01" /LENGTH=252 /DNA_ID=CAMNT_0020942925 /DNA_START=78 /DNA_END=836 /DNA_ORIENTATION=-